MLGLFSLCSIMSAVQWITLAPLFETLENTYGVGATEVNLVSMITMFGYVVANFPSNYALDYYGLKAGLIIGATLSTTGAWVKVLISEGFFWVYVGQTLSALGQPFILNA